jgi:hypothetical protein
LGRVIDGALRNAEPAQRSPYELEVAIEQPA